MHNPNFNKQITQELDDLENFSGRKYILEEKRLHSGYLWWRKTTYRYCLYLEITEGAEYQVLTATRGDGSQVLAFLLGANNYYEKSKAEEMAENKLYYQLPKAIRFWDQVYHLNPSEVTITERDVNIVFTRQ